MTENKQRLRRPEDKIIHTQFVCLFVFSPKVLDSLKKVIASNYEFCLAYLFHYHHKPPWNLEEQEVTVAETPLEVL